MNEMIHKMEQHVSVRKYKEEPIPKDVVERMVQAAAKMRFLAFCTGLLCYICNRSRLKGETSRVIRKSSCERLRDSLFVVQI